MFVNNALNLADERLERRIQLKMKGFDLKGLAGYVEKLLGLEKDAIHYRGRYTDIVKARDLFSYWAVREIGVKSSEIARLFNLTPSAISASTRRGEKMTKKEGYKLGDWDVN